MFAFSACFVRSRAKSGCSECKWDLRMGSGDEIVVPQHFFHYENFFCACLSAFCCCCCCCWYCERRMCKVLSWKLADSNLEKLYLAGFLRHGFLIKRTFTFLLPSCLGFDFFPFSFATVEWILASTFLYSSLGHRIIREAFWLIRNCFRWAERFPIFIMKHF